MVENHQKGMRIKRPVDDALQGGCGESSEVSWKFNFAVRGMQCLKQSESESRGDRICST